MSQLYILTLFNQLSFIHTPQQQGAVMRQVTLLTIASKLKGAEEEEV